MQLQPDMAGTGREGMGDWCSWASLSPYRRASPCGLSAWVCLCFLIVWWPQGSGAYYTVAHSKPDGIQQTK